MQIAISMSAVAVTTSDSVNFTGGPTRAIYIGGAGDVTAVMADGTTALFKAMPLGLYPLSIKRINATGTAATNILALY